MKRASAGIAFLVLCLLIVSFPNSAFGQTAATQSPNAQSAKPQPAAFEAAEIDPSAHRTYQYMRGPTFSGDRYIIKDATMIDLISTAYDIQDESSILGGPAWLEIDRFDVTAKLPPDPLPDAEKQMLQALLADRFKLVTHHDSKPLQAYLLELGKGKPKLNASDGSQSTGCEGQQQNPQPAIPTIVISCHNMTMAAFADAVHDMAGGYLTDGPVVDTTGLQGAWDFDLKWTPRGALARAGDDGISIFNAVDQELGLKLELKTAPQPVLVVDSVSEKPTPNAADIAKVLPPLAPMQFDVAVINPSKPDEPERGRIDGGQLSVQGLSMKFLIEFAWDLNDNDSEMVVNAPKWLDTEKFDVLAKADIAPPANGKRNAQQIDQDDLEAMLRSLLIDRFQMKVHMEDRPVTAYTLVADKPKLTKGDATVRTRCKEGPGPDGKDPRISNPVLNRLVTCQNMTMAEFADELQDLVPGYIFTPVKDGTGLQGGWDFTLWFSGAGQLPGATPPSAGQAPGSSASEPTGALSLFDAIQKELGLKLVKEMRPAPVLVIDHINEQPTPN
jgi:uncharacterized protein (TIGR03435 family)